MAAEEILQHILKITNDPSQKPVELTGEDVLDLEMITNDAEAKTIRDYLKALVTRIWEEGEGFSGKRPFGNSGWEYELYGTLVTHGFRNDDWDVMNDAIYDAIEAL